MYIHQHPVHYISDGAKQNVYYIMSSLKSTLHYTVIMYMIVCVRQNVLFCQTFIYDIHIFFNYL